MLHFLRNRNGQGILESLLALPLVILSTSSILFLCYRGVVYFYADFYLHEALICTDESSDRSCSQELENKLNAVLIGNEKSTARVHRGPREAQGRLEIHFPFIASNFGPPLVIEKRLSFPVKAD
ncbi:hypothetical protein [Bdellovibrio sp.]|uniref:hypothetical protein n=1 Tax=Bdellovibrio sp. TaxID=28201 RepID=UPI002F35FBB7